MAYDARLLADEFAPMEYGEVGDSAHIIAGGQVLVFVGVDLENYSLAGHVFGRLGDLGSCDAAGSTPLGPEVDEDGNARTLNDLVEDFSIDLQWFVEGRQVSFACAATTGIVQMVGG
jgi:hypothetical protein